MKLVALLWFACGCSALAQVTPEQRHAAYENEARAFAAVCKAYGFDLESGLVTSVPEMDRLCKDESAR